MGILNFIDRISAQKAVYWGTPTKNGFGGYTYADPVEIDCRWENKDQTVIDRDGNEITVDVIILTNADLVLGGRLYLGELTDLDSDPDPYDLGTNKTSYEILSIRKIPLIKSNVNFVKTYYLNKNHRSVREV